MEGAREGFAKVRHGEKGFPPSGSTKDGKRQKDFHEGPPGVGGDTRGTRKGQKVHEGRQKAKRFPRRATKDGKGPLRRWRGLKRGPPTSTKEKAKRFHEGPRRTAKGHSLEGAQEGFAKETKVHEKGAKRKKKISTKGHEGRRRATKALEGAQEGFAKGRQGEKGFPPSGSTGKGKKIPRRATKDGKGPLRRWRRLKRGSPRFAKGRKDFQAKRFPRREKGH